MSITTRKVLSFLTFSVFFSILGTAQVVEKITVEGVEYYVYPFKMEVRQHSDYWNILKQKHRDEISYREYKRDWAGEFGESPSRSAYREFKTFMAEMNGFDKERKKYLNRKLIKAARSNPYPLLEQRMIENVDVVPSLDPIPDGKYIQLYEDFCFSDKKGYCSEGKQFIAGYFSIKNNMLDGEATWVDLKGDTLKHGWFKNGLKEGKWMLTNRETEYVLTPNDAKMYIEKGEIYKDTLIEYMEYSQGAKHGKYVRYFSSAFPTQEGFYTKGEMSGEWIYRNIVFKGIGPFRKRIRNNEQISLRYTLNDNDSLVAHGPWIRKDKISFYDADDQQFNFMYDLSLDELPTLYAIAFEKKPQVDLEEETISLNEMEEAMSYQLNERTYNNYYSEGAFSYYQPGHFDEKSGSIIKRGVLLDSLGGIPYYQGVYERYYSNGQLMMQFTFENGALVDQGTIYWDNGAVHDKIEFVEDSNQYLRSIYDYDGKLFLELSYDSLGDFNRVVKEHQEARTAVLDNLVASEAAYGKYYVYDKLDTLSNELTEPLIIFRSWSKDDSTRLYSSFYDPMTRKLVNSDYSFSGKEVKTYTSNFAENFESWTGKSVLKYQDLELQMTNSGTLYEGLESDSIPQMNIPKMHNIFEVASEYLYLKDGQPYTGAVEFDFSAKKLAVSQKGMKIDLPLSETKTKKLLKDAEKFKKTGETKYPEIFDYFDYSDLNRGKGGIIFDDFFNLGLGGFFSTYSYYDEYEHDHRGKRSKSVYPELDRLEGQMLNGKPEGVWTAYDQFGQKMTEVPFVNGEANGRVNYFACAYPRGASEEYYYEYGNDFAFDSFPTKKKYYLNMSADYKNGFLDGKEIEYNWYGEVISEFSYVEGLREGPGIERNAIAYTKSYFQKGMLDGYVQTYLTLPKRDSILLFDLNFQDGMLQGESKSYHTNGNISKRGFFLNGEPIQDYEAFDSLGVKYHYVKFKYSFPVEEKIWEENELSVRYLFNWEDSIYFEPSDITTSQSLDEVMYDLGYGYEYLEQPYYGRPSLVSKTGIKYHMTKYYPNDTIARDGDMNKGRKVGCWKHYAYDGKPLYEIDYFDSLVKLNDSIEFFSRGIYSELSPQGKVLSESYIIEKSEKYDCSHSDHYEIRQFYTIWEASDTTNRMNGYVKNYYDNGTIQSEGEMKDGLPTGFWKYYDPFGKLNKYGQYVLGKRNGRWLSGDLSKTKYLGDICLNPNLPDLEKEIKYRENLLDITIISYAKGKVLNRQYYDVNMNRFNAINDEVEEQEELEGEDSPREWEEDQQIDEE